MMCVEEGVLRISSLQILGGCQQSSEVLTGHRHGRYQVGRLLRAMGDGPSGLWENRPFSFLDISVTRPFSHRATNHPLSHSQSCTHIDSEVPFSAQGWPFNMDLRELRE